MASQAAAGERQSILNQLEAVMGELSGFDLSTEMSSFFNTWSEAANLTQSNAVVVEQGEKLAAFVRTLRSDMLSLREQIETQLDERVSRADTILTQIASINAEISGIEGSGATANELRDRRDELLGELAGYLDISAVEDPQGVVDVFVGSTPILLGGSSRGCGSSARATGLWKRRGCWWATTTRR